MATEKTHTGHVLWFDHKKGFGFVNVNQKDSEFFDKNIFVHFSKIMTKADGFKKIFPGEYVSMKVTHQPDVEGKEFLCEELTGVNGGPLLIDNENYNFKVFNKVRRVVEQN